MSSALDNIFNIVNQNKGKVVNANVFHKNREKLNVSKSAIYTYICKLHKNGILTRVKRQFYLVNRGLKEHEKKFMRYTPQQLKKMPSTKPTKKQIPSQSSSEIVKSYFKKSEEYDLTKGLPYGAVIKISKELNLPKKEVTNTILSIRRGLSVNINRKSESISKPTTNRLVKIFEKFGVERQAPNQNRSSSNKIIHALEHLIPAGGAGLLIGTPTPFATSPRANNNLLLTDEFEIAIALKMKCQYLPTIVVGNLISPEKATIKGEFWKSNNSTCNCDVIVDLVNRDSYTRYVTQVAEKHPLSKVVLVTSGVWKCCHRIHKKYGFNFDFQAPSKYLTSIYPNLHILAMVMGDRRRPFQFDVHYLHNGEDIVIE